MFLKAIYIINSAPVSKTELLTGKDLKKDKLQLHRQQWKSSFGYSPAEGSGYNLENAHSHLIKTMLIQWPRHAAIPEALENPTGGTIQGVVSLIWSRFFW